jgi:hypothetical protein
MVRIADPTFGLDRYALPLMTILSMEEPDFAEFLDEAQMYDVTLLTDVYRTGNRSWISVTMFGALEGRGPRKVIAFGMDPFADAIGVEVFDITEAPELADVPSQMVRFPPRDLMRVAGHIKSLLAEAYKALRSPQA